MPLGSQHVGEAPLITNKFNGSTNGLCLKKKLLLNLNSFSQLILP